MKKKTAKRISAAIALFFAVAFLVKFGSTKLLKAYIELGLGSCEKNPIFCLSVDEEVLPVETSGQYLNELIPYNLPKIEILLPKGFDVKQEQITKHYYKRRKARKPGSIYLLYQPPGFFPALFPNLKKEGIVTNYDFISRVMQANLSQIKSITDGFFVIMKGIFTPDLGDQRYVKTSLFKNAHLKGFINYNLSPAGNYFDCNLISKGDHFFKVYIRDNEKKLELSKVLLIISTVKHPASEVIKSSGAIMSNPRL